MSESKAALRVQLGTARDEVGRLRELVEALNLEMRDRRGLPPQEETDWYFVTNGSPLWFWDRR